MHEVRRHPLTRRAFRGAAGGVMTLPFLAHLTGADVAKKVDGKIIAAPSVDQVAAKAVRDHTFLPSLELGLSSHETQYSWRSADSRVPYEANPRLVFDRMFRGRPPVVPNWK